MDTLDSLMWQSENIGTAIYIKISACLRDSGFGKAAYIHSAESFGEKKG